MFLFSFCCNHFVQLLLLNHQQTLSIWILNEIQSWVHFAPLEATGKLEQHHSKSRWLALNWRSELVSKLARFVQLGERDSCFCLRSCFLFAVGQLKVCASIGRKTFHSLQTDQIPQTKLKSSFAFSFQSGTPSLHLS